MYTGDLYARAVLLEPFFVGDGQFMTSLCSAASQYLTAVLTAHTRTEAVLVHSLSPGWLVSSFHYSICFLLLAKVGQR